MKPITSLLLVILASQTVNTSELPTVKEIDILAYLGDWWEVVSSPIVHMTWERNSYCVSTTYQLRDDYKISVRDVQRKGRPDGDITEMNGYAFQPDPVNFPGKLKINFNSFIDGNYWIVKLGPIVNEKYEYAIVSEPLKLFMWVLARDPTTYFQKYGEDNKNYLISLGFDGILNGYVERDNSKCLPYNRIKL